MADRVTGVDQGVKAFRIRSGASDAKRFAKSSGIDPRIKLPALHAAGRGIG